MRRSSWRHGFMFRFFLIFHAVPVFSFYSSLLLIDVMPISTKGSAVIMVGWVVRATKSGGLCFWWRREESLFRLPLYYIVLDWCGVVRLCCDFWEGRSVVCVCNCQTPSLFLFVRFLFSQACLCRARGDIQLVIPTYVTRGILDLFLISSELS